ncbi:uncharacterized protein LOC136749532 [Amia ocellicauda]|uniref:uncharacterized protein LOC136749532 n=1 Tax=Amia ocellicauda TaxID=2972642 RepID=UPI00346412DC
MLQQNNNNNYSCLERGCNNRQIILEANSQGGGPPFASLLQVASLQEFRGAQCQPQKLKGFRSWAVSSVCAKNRKKAALSKSDPRPCFQGSGGITVSKTKGVNNTPASAGSRLKKSCCKSTQSRPSVSLEVQIKAATSICCQNPRSRAGNVGSLVTVATLKASEGSKTQTQCFFLKSEAQNYCCATRSNYRRPPPSLASESSTKPEGKHGFLVGERPEDTMTGEGSSCAKEHTNNVAKKAGSMDSKPHEQTGQEGPALDVLTIDLKPIQKWDKLNGPLPFEDGIAGVCEDCGLQSSEETRQGRRTGRDCIVQQLPKAAGQENRIMEHDRQEHSSTQGQVEICVHSCDSQKGAESPGNNDQRRPPVEGMRDISKEHDNLTGSFKEESATVLSLPPQRQYCCSPSQLAESHTDRRTLEKASTTDVPSGRKQNTPLDKVDQTLGFDRDEATNHGTREFKDKVMSPFRHTSSHRDRHWHGCNVSYNPQEFKISDSNPEGGSMKCTVESPHRGVLAQPHGVTCNPSSWQCPTMGQADSDSRANHYDLPKGETNGNQGVQYAASDCRQKWFTGCQDSSEHSIEDSPGKGEWIQNAGEQHIGGKGCTTRSDPACVWASDSPPSRGPATGAAKAPAGLNPPVTMATPSAQEGSPSEVEGRLPSPSAVGQLCAHGNSAANEMGRPGIEPPAADDEFGLFVQAGEHLCWEDSFADFNQVPCGQNSTTAPAHTGCETASLCPSSADATVCQPSEDTWAVFPQEGSSKLTAREDGKQQFGTGGPWWPENAVEESRKPTLLDLPTLLQESFPSETPPSCETESIPTLYQLLRGQRGHTDTAGEQRSWLEGLQDVNEMIGLKFRWPESVSQTLLLQSLHLEADCKDNGTNPRMTTDSPCRGVVMVRQWTPPARKTKAKVAYDINKNLLH